MVIIAIIVIISIMIIGGLHSTLMAITIKYNGTHYSDDDDVVV